eukprot:5747920-Karenia_brevis.AAC.1
MLHPLKGELLISALETPRTSDDAVLNQYVVRPGFCTDCLNLLDLLDQGHPGHLDPFDCSL